MRDIRLLRRRSRCCSAKNLNWRGMLKYNNSEIRALHHYLGDMYADHEREYTNEENLQLAFLKTFPNNICLAADEGLEYPFYMMVKDKLLLKVHGSSVVTLLAPKPKWVCCQNLILSSITGRPMARVLVPIKDKLLEKTSKGDYRKAMKMDQQNLPQKLVEKDVPTAILRFFRSKNHNDFIQKELNETKAYLETDEDRELSLYFYTKDLTREDEQRKEMISMKMRVNDYAEEVSKKKHHLFSVSDRTKMQVNEHGVIVDVLNSQQFLSFVIKTLNDSYKLEIKEIAEEMGVQESNYYIRVNKEKNLTTLHFNNKLQAKTMYDRMTAICRRRGVGCKHIFNQVFHFVDIRQIIQLNLKNGKSSYSGMKARKVHMREYIVRARRSQKK